MDHMVMVFRPSSGLVIVAVESAQKDEMLKGLVRELKASVKHQFTGTRAEILCVKFRDITQQELLDVALQDKSGNPSELQRASSYLLGREDWQHVHTLAYFTPGLVKTTRTAEGTSVTRSSREQGRPYVFTNPKHVMAQNRRFSIF